MKMVMGLIAALSIPLIILNMLGGVVSGLWLAILGEWGVIGRGLLFFFTSTFLIGFALMPSLLLVAPAAYFMERGKSIGLILFGGLSSVYTLGLVTVWCCGILYLFVKDATAASLIPRLIWSYGVATGPWAYMASKEQTNDGGGFASAMSTFLAQVAYIVIMIVIIFFPISLLGAVKIFAAFMLVGLVLQMTFAVLMQLEQKRFAAQATDFEEFIDE